MPSVMAYNFQVHLEFYTSIDVNCLCLIFTFDVYKKESDFSVLFVSDMMISDRSYKTYSHIAFIQRSSMFSSIVSFLIRNPDFINKYFKMAIETIWNHRSTKHSLMILDNWTWEKVTWDFRIIPFSTLISTTRFAKLQVILCQFN